MPDLRKLFAKSAGLAALLLALAAGCSRSARPDRTIAGPKDLVGRRQAVVVGSMMGDMTDRIQPGILTEWFNDYNSGIEAVRIGKVDAMPLDFFYARRWARQNPASFAVTKPYHSIPWGYFFAKDSPLAARVNAVLAKMEASGDLDRILRRWSESENPGALEPEMPTSRADFTGKAGTLRFATPGDREPVSFMRADGIVGFDIDLVRRIAHELDMNLEIVQITMGALVPAVQSGKADMGGGGIAITAERAEKVTFSTCYYRVPTVFLVRSPQAARQATRTETSFWWELGGSFRRTFVTEGRWRMIVDGLGVTLLITFLSAVFGTLLAFPVWLSRTSRVKVVAAVARGYVAVVQGTPLLVLLMSLFYIVFGSVDLNGSWEAVIGFSLNASAYIGEMLRTGIASVPRGQTEAALALGYSPRRAFFGFVLPQAVRAILPVYRGQLVSMLKNTSIVGYIAINDLTKASDLIRSRTYESFFPILTTAFIYLVLSYLLATLLDRAGRRLNPKGSVK